MKMKKLAIFGILFGLSLYAFAETEPPICIKSNAWVILVLMDSSNNIVERLSLTPVRLQSAQWKGKKIGVARCLSNDVCRKPPRFSISADKMKPGNEILITGTFDEIASHVVGTGCQ